MRLGKVYRQPMVKVIRDSSDATRDRWMRADTAQELYDAGILVWDRTNGEYATRRPLEVLPGMITSMM